jgi:hypothetical protein
MDLRSTGSLERGKRNTTLAALMLNVLESINEVRDTRQAKEKAES